MKLLGVLVFVGLVGMGTVAIAADLGATAGEMRPLGYSMAELRGAFPDIPEDQLPSIVFRIPTIHSIMQAYSKAHPVSSDQSEDSDATSVS
jgi:hypothetical protein